MGIFSFFTILIVIFYLAIIVGILYMIYKWVNKFISLRQEQNDLLREIINKMDNNTDKKQA